MIVRRCGTAAGAEGSESASVESANSGLQAHNWSDFKVRPARNYGLREKAGIAAVNCGRVAHPLGAAASRARMGEVHRFDALLSDPCGSTVPIYPVAARTRPEAPRGRQGRPRSALSAAPASRHACSGGAGLCDRRRAGQQPARQAPVCAAGGGSRPCCLRSATAAPRFSAPPACRGWCSSCGCDPGVHCSR